MFLPLQSQLLLATSQLAARSVYVGGNTSSRTGLTVTLTKEENGEAGLQAGALVLADQGVCCLDEFDKMATSHQEGLLEAMEQQQVSIAKAGVVASLPARCSVVAAANPRHGSYSMSKSISENLNMAKPILSRFDLVFILRDKADQEQDRLVSSAIMGLHRGKSQQAILPSGTPSSGDKENQLGGVSANVKVVDGSQPRMPLKDRLAWVNGFQKCPLPASLIRDYVAYAREYCKPKLTPEAAQVLKDYFMELRYPQNGGRRRQQDSVPITTRQLEALIRLSQARAKACLRDFVLKEDALDVVELMMASVSQVHQDDDGIIDRGRGGAGGTSNRKMKKAFVKEIERLVGSGGRCTMDDLVRCGEECTLCRIGAVILCLHLSSQRRIAERVGCGLGEFHSTVEEMRNIGVIMKKSDGSFQIAN